jgi:hypothetical protein
MIPYEGDLVTFYSQIFSHRCKGITGLEEVLFFYFVPDTTRDNYIIIFLFYVRMTCGAECLSIGPPPDSILHMPPPPLPAFLASAANLTPPCRASKCPPLQNSEENALFPGVEYHELPRHGQYWWLRGQIIRIPFSPYNIIIETNLVSHVWHIFFFFLPFSHTTYNNMFFIMLW